MPGGHVSPSALVPQSAELGGSTWRWGAGCGGQIWSAEETWLEPWIMRC